MKTHFHMKGYAPRLAWKRGTRQLGNGLLEVVALNRSLVLASFLFCSFIGLLASVSPFIFAERCLANFSGKWKILLGDSIEKEVVMRIC